MALSARLKRFLDQQAANYETLPHHRTFTSLRTADTAHIPRQQFAKAVVMREDDEYLMMVIPADRHVHMGRLHHLLGHDVGLATEEELNQLFPDCECGAIPPVGAAYGLKTLIDESLVGQSDIYFEAGDHQQLVKMKADHFASLLGEVERVQVDKDL